MAIHSNRREKNELVQIIKRSKWNNFPERRCCIGYKADIKRESQACLIFKEDFGIGSRGVSSIVDSMH